jgi:hypothetical protein
MKVEAEGPIAQARLVMTPLGKGEKDCSGKDRRYNELMFRAVD